MLSPGHSDITFHLKRKQAIAYNTILVMCRKLNLAIYQLIQCILMSTLIKSYFKIDIERQKYFLLER